MFFFYRSTIMETGMLNSLHNEEEQFAIGGQSASHDSESPQWSGDTVLVFHSLVCE